MAYEYDEEFEEGIKSEFGRFGDLPNQDAETQASGFHIERPLSADEKKKLEAEMEPLIEQRLRENGMTSTTEITKKAESYIDSFDWDDPRDHPVIGEREVGEATFRWASPGKPAGGDFFTEAPDSNPSTLGIGGDRVEGLFSYTQPQTVIEGPVADYIDDTGAEMPGGGVQEIPIGGSPELVQLTGSEFSEADRIPRRDDNYELQEAPALTIKNAEPAEVPPPAIDTSNSLSDASASNATTSDSGAASTSSTGDSSSSDGNGA